MTQSNSLRTLLVLFLVVKACLGSTTTISRQKRQIFGEDIVKLKRPLDGSYNQRPQGEANQSNQPDQNNDVDNIEHHNLFTNNKNNNNNHNVLTLPNPSNSLGDISPIVPSGGYSQPLRFSENDANHININHLGSGLPLDNVNNNIGKHPNHHHNSNHLNSNSNNYFAGFAPSLFQFHDDGHNSNHRPGLSNFINNNNYKNNNNNRFVPITAPSGPASTLFHLESSFDNRLNALWNKNYNNNLPSQHGNSIHHHQSPISYTYRHD